MLHIEAPLCQSAPARDGAGQSPVCATQAAASRTPGGLGSAVCKLGLHLVRNFPPRHTTPTRRGTASRSVTPARKLARVGGACETPGDTPTKAATPTAAGGSTEYVRLTGLLGAVTQQIDALSEQRAATSRSARAGAQALREACDPSRRDGDDENVADAVAMRAVPLIVNKCRAGAHASLPSVRLASVSSAANLQ